MWLNKYPDGGTLGPKPKTQKMGGKDDPLRPKGLGVNATDSKTTSYYDPISEQNRVELNKLKSQPQLNTARTKNLYEQRVDQAKKEAYVASHPNAQLVNGNLTTKNAAYNLENQPVGPHERRAMNKGEHVIGAAEAALLLTGVGEAYGLAKPALKQAAKYLTEQTVLKNTYKINPFAFKPNPQNYYRMIGKEGSKDAFESGIIRANPNNVHSFDGTPIYDKPYFSVGKPLDRNWQSPLSKKKGSIYSGPEMVEVNNANKFHPTNDLVAVPNQPLNPLDTDTKFFKENWLRGYKEMPKPRDINNTYWNGRTYQQGPTSTQEVISTSSGMDALPAGYNAHLRNQTPYVAAADEAMMPTQGRINWNGVNYDNVENWFNTRPTKTIKTSGANTVSTGNITNVTNAPITNTRTGVDIPGSLKNIEPSDYNYVNMGETPIKGQGYAVDAGDYVGGLSNPAWRKDAGNTVGKWFNENKVKNGDAITTYLSNPTTQTNTLGKNSIKAELSEFLGNFNPKNTRTRSGLDWMKSWYSHPNFNKRYAPTGEFSSDTMQEHVTKQLAQYEPKNYIDLLKDKGAMQYLERSASTGGVSWGIPSEIYTNRTMYAPFNKKGLESVRTHELTHLIENNGHLLSESDNQALLKPFEISGPPKNPNKIRQIFGDRPEYFLQPTEVHARMNQGRFDLGLSPDDVFTEKMFNDISKKKDWYGMGKYIKNKPEFVNLMNKFWAVPPAAIGVGALQQKENGGTLNNWLNKY